MPDGAGHVLQDMEKQINILAKITTKTQLPERAATIASWGEKVEDEKLSDKCLPILVHKFHADRWVTSHVVPRKGADPWAVTVAAADLEQSGLSKFIYKSDGENSIKSLKREVIRKLKDTVGDVQAIPEESGVGESQQNQVLAGKLIHSI